MSRAEEIRCKVLVVGVGGQGVLTAARMLGEAARAAGLDVLVGQLHGMAQRGGSVESSVLIGPYHSAFIGPGEADVVLGLEPLETKRAVEKISPRTTVVFDRSRIVPFILTRLGREYPEVESIEQELRSVANQVWSVDGRQAAEQAGDVRALDMVMLGTLPPLDVLPFGEDVLLSAIEQCSPEPRREINCSAFRLGAGLVQMNPVPVSRQR